MKVGDFLSILSNCNPDDDLLMIIKAEIHGSESHVFFGFSRFEEMDQSSMPIMRDSAVFIVDVTEESKNKLKEIKEKNNEENK